LFRRAPKVKQPKGPWLYIKFLYKLHILLFVFAHIIHDLVLFSETSPYKQKKGSIKAMETRLISGIFPGVYRIQ